MAVSPPAEADAAASDDRGDSRAAVELAIDAELVKRLGWISPPEEREGKASLELENELASIAAWVAPVWDQLERVALRVVPRAQAIELQLVSTFRDPDAAEGAVRMLHGLAAMWAARIERSGEGGSLVARALFAVRASHEARVATAVIALPPHDALRVLAWLTGDERADAAR